MDKMMPNTLRGRIMGRLGVGTVVSGGRGKGVVTTVWGKRARVRIQSGMRGERGLLSAIDQLHLSVDERTGVTFGDRLTVWVKPRRSHPEGGSHADQSLISDLWLDIMSTVNRHPVPKGGQQMESDIK